MENTNRNNDTATRIARSHGNNSARFCGGVVEMPKNVNRSENREAMKSPHSTKFLNRENTSLYFEEPEATHVPCSSAKVLLFILGIIRFCVSGRMGSTGSGDGEGEGLGCAVSGVLWSGNFLLKIIYNQITGTTIKFLVSGIPHAIPIIVSILAGSTVPSLY